ncbi:fungal specific transcription factor [Colletotrichum costaricense]|uniref:Fungal specific transcription factor n=1 Tax=Colletotrichum costaricense TaxID=1209916 RepID=A0AAI9YNY7_9PEZI|nr:fungal specific transcription factor [Colletotrichum costaricense]KAK1517966.1 fungal specific transcription factor [Colletotrichum costaricense]
MDADPGTASTLHEAMDQAHDDNEENEDDEIPLSKISVKSPHAFQGHAHGVLTFLIKCDRCRRRKVRCDRRHPCAYCLRIDAPCTYPERQRPKERRQRIFISEVYERKIDFIAKKLEELGHALGDADSRSQPQNSSTKSYRSSSSVSPASAHNSTAGNLTVPSPASGDNGKILTPKLEYEGESSLSAQAAFADRFLRDAVSNKPSVDITGEMASVLDTMSRTIGNQKREQEPEYLYPHARTLEPGQGLRDLPMPPVQSAFACLRLAKEHRRVKFFWNHEASSVSAFTDYFLKVYSPGYAAHADLIIVNAGLYWLFLECKNVTTDPDKKADYTEQATMCRANLETVLSSLPFHLPSTMDTTYAMTLAATYCLDVCKPSAAWNFIATASHMSQTLGMHSIVTMINDDPEVKREKLKLFWLIYVHEKALSLRLGRSSTIRDNDITVPPMAINSRSEQAIFGQLQKWTELARLQGMVYDQIYSPAALIQPQSVRVAKARRLASELGAHTTKVSPEDKRYIQAMKGAVGELFYEAFVSTQRLTHLSLFCLIYRAIPAEQGEGTVFGKECIATARQALEEHQKCMAIIHELDEDFLETYVNWALLQSPFVPFTVLFCHVIETCNEADLQRLGGLIGSLQSLLADDFSTGVKKEIRLFQVLYDVACSYIKMKTNESPQTLDPSAGVWATAAATSLMTPSSVHQNVALTGQGLGTQDGPQTEFPSTEESQVCLDAAFDGQNIGSSWMSGGSFTMPGDLGMEVDQQGTQLGNWLYMNNQMIRALEDSYF